ETFWYKLFLEADEQIINYIKEFPNSNPIIQRLKHNQASVDYEIFNYEQIRNGGSFYMHFDVEKMKKYQKYNSLPIKTIKLDDLAIDPDTPLLKHKFNDVNLPYFVRMYGTRESFICVDGNKRILAKMEKGQQEFDGYLFEDHILQDMFLGAPDLSYYIFNKECEYMFRVMNEQDSTDQDVLQVTQMYLQQ